MKQTFYNKKKKAGVKVMETKKAKWLTNTQFIQLHFFRTLSIKENKTNLESF